MVSGEIVAPAAVITTGTGADVCPSTSWTTNCATAGLATSPLPTDAARVVELTTVVARELPFQRTVAWLLKFDPITLMVRFVVPAATV